VRLARIALLVNGVLFASYGLLCLVMPETLTGAATLGLTTTVASIEVRAMYGGLELALGVLFLLAASRPTLLEAGLITGVTIFSGLGLARLLGIVLDGGPGTYNIVAVIYELTAAAVMLVAFGRVGSPLTEF
jgi:hypothetical protein